MEPSLPGTEARAQIAELNALFLTLLEALADAPDDFGTKELCGLTPVDLQRLLGLEADMRDELSAAPVALFHLPLAEPGPGDAQDPLPWMPAGPFAVRHAFALTALAGAWHLARTHPAWVGIGFGFDARQLAQLQRCTLAELPRLAGAAAAGLRVRFEPGHRFWSLALGLAGRDAVAELRLIAAAAFHMASAERMAARAAAAFRPDPLAWPLAASRLVPC